MAPYDRAVQWLLPGLVGLLVGIVVGLLVARAVHDSRHPVDTLASSVAPAQVSPELKRALTLAHGPGIVVGPHDEVLHSTVAARSGGLTVQSRIVDAEVLDMVRRTRREGVDLTRDLELDHGPTRAVQHLTVRTGPLDPHGNVLLMAADRAPLMRVDETRRDFVANISHELKTPIGAISILSEAVSDAADDPEAVRHFAGRLTDESSRLGELVGQIINLSRLQSDEPLLRAELLAVDALVAEAVDHNRELAGSRHVDLVVRTEEGLTVMGDRNQLVDAVSNLVHNAIAYSEPRARVAVSSRGVDGLDPHVEIIVADNGIGIREEDQQRIFERFYRVDYGRSRQSGGTGLGLSLVKHIAGAHGGSIDLWSKVGQGSTFTLSLPLPATDDESDGAGATHPVGKDQT